MAYVEPCCCERQLPKLLRNEGVFFQTSGDVTAEHLMKSIGCMVCPTCDLWLMIPAVNVKLLRVIRHWFRQKWMAGLHLLTREDQAELVKAELKDVIDSVDYAHDKMVVDGSGLLAFVDVYDEVVAVQGDMLTAISPGMRMYAGIYGRMSDERVKGMMEPLMSKMRVKKMAAAKPQHTEK